ncbi:MAG TPA: SDR family oxidoreductase [Ornithinimicrobium sp.]|uniref:SDR family NAD(P)-dependent oxidoreductase n=1 Tax=Ornithinimicrobium sp. TaxID=1977084 RepID=UPI002B45B0C9|nr:SDR family oxidoreductase [Ornithinimicrobium sp.]HKJ12254.1 SDR family oxidoreductase [Ornithinimicrobium sp.]
MDAPVALVAGGSRGLGLLVARELLQRGHAVAICARTSADVGQAVQLLQEHGTVRGYTCDVAERDQVECMLASVVSDLGEIEVLVTVAGIIQVGPANAMTLEHFDQALGTMLHGPVQLTWLVLPSMRARGHGRIGTVTSIGGVVAPPHLLPYATAKFGAVGFSEGLAAELAGTGVTSTTIVPGLIRTGSHERALFTGDAGAEYAWFAPGASLPLLSMRAERVAGKLVDGVLAGKPRVSLHPMTHVGTRVHGVAPATTVRLLGLMNRALPRSQVGTLAPTVQGRQAARDLGSRVVSGLTTLGSRAAARLNQR